MAMVIAALARFGNLNILLAVVIGFAALGGLASVGRHYYNAGWAAHERRVAAEIRRVNLEREQLATELARERVAAAIERQRAAEEAIAAFEAEQAAFRDPAATAGNSPASCGLPAGVIAKLNAIR